MAGRLDQIAVLLVTLCMAVWCSTITPQPPEQQGVKEFGLSTQKSAQDHSSVLETTVHPEVLGSEGSQPLTTSKNSFSNNKSQAGPPGSVADFKPHMPDILRISSVSINALSSDENQDGSARVVGNASANPGNSWSHSPASSMNSLSSNQDLGIGGSQGQTGEDNGAHLEYGRQKNTKCNPCTSSQDKCQIGEVCETDDNCLKWCRKPDGSSIPLESYGKKTTSEDIGFFRSGKQEKIKKGADPLKSFLTKNKLFSLIASSGKEAKDVGKVNPGSSH